MRKVCFLAALLGATVVLPNWAAAGEPRPAGVSRFIGFSVQPVYPKSYDIVAFATHSILGHCSTDELKDAWQKKAVMVANGRKFKISKLTMHDSESDYENGWPVKSRSVSGTITLTD
jgi:hypothetical protein